MNRLVIASLAIFFATWAYAADPPAAAKAQTDALTATPPSPGGSSLPKPAFDLMDSQRIAAGRARFDSLCNFFCHGSEGSAGKTLAFKGRTDFTPEMLFQVITEGIKPEMPAYQGLAEDKRWEVVAYVMHLGRQKADR
ncbi:MAG: cytochrome c [Proteobacteria bacterium]|nr:cytochrome c [Pseudomonadota bacterium]